MEQAPFTESRRRSHDVSDWCCTAQSSQVFGGGGAGFKLALLEDVLRETPDDKDHWLTPVVAIGSVEDV